MEERQGLRITTWNVNGIRNPFGYQPWRQERTFAAMFEILEADIVVMQETKIQRKDLKDDMVLVPGWDAFFSLPKHKKGYSGVAVYTRNSICAPVRAEEGITGILTPPNSTTSFFDLPESQQIGGYPTARQLAVSSVDAATLDSEGRCVILEFPAFVLIGTYCPANRDETRDEFRMGFLIAVDARVRNLIAMGKKVFWTGDLNIIRSELDTAKVEEQLKKQGITVEEFFSTPARKLLNQLLVGGKVYGERDEGREKPVMWDICRGFHPTRKGMFTCWEQKINARPGNFGSRIDYVLCSVDWKDWFCESNIQEGLMGSDHCPVYAVLKPKVEIAGQEVDIRDLMSSGMFKGGIREREWSVKDLLPMSAKLIPEFDRRRSIKDMFGKRPSMPKEESSAGQKNENQSSEAFLIGEGSLPLRDVVSQSEKFDVEATTTEQSASVENDDPSAIGSRSSMSSPAKPLKRSNENSNILAGRPQKRGKASTISKSTNLKGQAGKGQSSLVGFFKPKTPQPESQSDSQTSALDAELDSTSFTASVAASDPPTPAASISDTDALPSNFQASDQKDIFDPIVAKESWGKLLGKRVAPKCEHNEPCISLITKKTGVNCGRSFYMCSRPIGPSGQKEKNTEWRCGTFIWSSDWTGE